MCLQEIDQEDIRDIVEFFEDHDKVYFKAVFIQILRMARDG